MWGIDLLYVQKWSSILFFLKVCSILHNKNCIYLCIYCCSTSYFLCDKQRIHGMYVCMYSTVQAIAYWYLRIMGNSWLYKYSVCLQVLLTSRKSDVKYEQKAPPNLKFPQHWNTSLWPTVQAQSRSRIVGLFIFDLGFRLGWVINSILEAINPGKVVCCQLHGELHEPQSQSGGMWRRGNLLPSHSGTEEYSTLLKLDVVLIGTQVLPLRKVLLLLSSCRFSWNMLKIEAARSFEIMAAAYQFAKGLYGPEY